MYQGWLTKWTPPKRAGKLSWVEREKHTVISTHHRLAGGLAGRPPGGPAASQELKYQRMVEERGNTPTSRLLRFPLFRRVSVPLQLHNCHASGLSLLSHNYVTTDTALGHLHWMVKGLGFSVASENPGFSSHEPCKMALFTLILCFPAPALPGEGS